MGVIYKILNKKTNDFYIGSAIDFKKRKWSHLHELRNNKHHSPILQNSWNKYDEKTFEFIIIEEVEKENLITREQYYIDSLIPRYNCSKTAGSPLGVKHTAQSRKNMSEAHKGKKLSAESIRKRTLKQSGENHCYFGKQRTQEVKDKISKTLKEKYQNGIISQKGKIISSEVRQKISETLMKPVLQFSKEGEFIREWKGAPEAAKELNLHKSNISQTCLGKLKTSGGFIWKYKIITNE